MAEKNYEESENYKAYSKKKRDYFKGQPATWDGAEKKHSLIVGDEVVINIYGDNFKGTVIELTDWHGGLASYKVEVKEKNGRFTKYPDVMFNKNPQSPWYITSKIDKNETKKAEKRSDVASNIVDAEIPVSLSEVVDPATGVRTYTVGTGATE